MFKDTELHFTMLQIPRLPIFCKISWNVNITSPFFEKTIVETQTTKLNLT